VASWRFTFLQDAYVLSISRAHVADLFRSFIPVLEEAFSVQPPPTYATIMRLDTRIRDLPSIDANILGLDVMSMTGAECMQLFCIGGMKQLILLYLHRRFLFEAISDEKCADISTHKYAYSVNVALKSAITMTRQTRGVSFVPQNAFNSSFYFILLTLSWSKAYFGKTPKWRLDCSLFGFTGSQVRLIDFLE